MSSFHDFGLNAAILKAIGEMGFVTPTPIQEKTIPGILRSGRDLIALAQTGTGKTAGFGLPVIHQVIQTERFVQALILCPTRELCLQIANDLNSFTRYMGGVSVVAVYGGTSIVPQLKSLQSGAHIVVGTPGRTLDLINRGALNISRLRWLILDEADEMLNMGFKDDLDAILETTPDNKQTLLFSATMQDGVRHIAHTYMNDPEELSVGKKNSGAQNIEHQYFMVKSADRYLALKRIADINPDIYGIIFCRTRSETKEVAEKLMQDGYNADALHGDLSQAQRDYVMQRFRTGNLQLLVATDVAARGLDVNDLSHVINYNLPDDPEVYVHRSGRTGRAGKSGISVAIINTREKDRIRQIEKMGNIKFAQQMVPTGREICEKRLFSVIEKMQNTEVDHSQIDDFLPAIYEKLEGLSREDLIKKFVSTEFNQFLEYYRNDKDLNAPRQEDSGRDREKRQRSGRTDFSRFYINIGTKQDLTPQSLIGLINDCMQTREVAIGKIDILRKFTFFEADSAFGPRIIEALDGIFYKETPLSVQLSELPPKEFRGGYNDRYEKPRDKDKRHSPKSYASGGRSGKSAGKTRFRA